jgi:hypothetical protein
MQQAERDLQYITLMLTHLDPGLHETDLGVLP